MVKINSMRMQILKFLSSGEPVRFTDITKGLGKADFAVNRELTALRDCGWVIRTGEKRDGRYFLNLVNEDVKKALLKLKTTPSFDDTFHEVKIDTEANKIILENFIDDIDEYKDDIKKKELVKAALAFSHLDIVVVGEKIDGLSQLLYVPNDVALFMQKIAEARVTAKLDNLTADASDAEIVKIHTETLNQPFKVVLSWNPSAEPQKYQDLLYKLYEKAVVKGVKK